MEEVSEEEIKKQLVKLSAVNERYKQEAYELKRKLNNAEAMEREAVQQVESVQAELSKEKARGNNMSAQHSKDINALNRQWMEKLEAMEQNFLEEKHAYENKIGELEGKIAELSNVSAMDSTETVLELEKLKSSNQELVNLVHSYEEKLAKEKQQSVSLDSVLREMSRELEVAKSNYEQKKEDLASAQEIIDNVQGEAMQLKLELERLKAADSSHLKRGNSLFAEVEDRRKVMQGHLDSAKSKLRKMKTALKNKDTEISKLRADKSYLSFQFKSLEKECKLTDTQWHSTYTQRIQELQRTVSELRGARQAVQPMVVDDDNFKWVSQLLADKQAEVRRLEEALEEKSMTCLMSADCLQQARRNLQTTRAELLTAKATVTDLRMALLTTNPDMDIGIEQIVETAGMGLHPVDEDCQISNKENEVSADVQKFLTNEHKIGNSLEQSCAQIGSVAEKMRKSLVSVNIDNNKDNSDKINFPILL